MQLVAFFLSISSQNAAVIDGSDGVVFVSVTAHMQQMRSDR